MEQPISPANCNYHQQNSFYQITWLERPIIQWSLAMLVAGGSWWILYGGIRIIPNTVISSISIFWVLAGLALDIYLTHITLKLKPEFNRRGILFLFAEGNRLLPKYPTLKQQLSSLRILVAAVVIAIAYFVPPFGFATATLHIVAAIVWAKSRSELLQHLKIWDLRLGVEGIPRPNKN